MSISDSDFDKWYLVCLMEECAEVIQGAAKCMRFGMADGHLSYREGLRNDLCMFQEIGDILGVLDAAYPNWEKNNVIVKSRKDKIKKLEIFGPYGSFLKRKK